MRFFTKVREVEAQQFTGNPRDITLVELKPVYEGSSIYAFQCPDIEEHVTVLPEDWIVAIDECFEVYSALDFETRFSSQNIVESLQKTIEMQAKKLLAVHEAMKHAHTVDQLEGVERALKE